MIEDSPFEDARRPIRLWNDFQPQFACSDRFEGCGVELIRSDSKSLGPGNWDEIIPVPVEDPAILRRLNPRPGAAGYGAGARPIDSPVDFDLVDFDRLAPFVLHPAFMFAGGPIGPNGVERVGPVV